MQVHTHCFNTLKKQYYYPPYESAIPTKDELMKLCGNCFFCLEVENLMGNPEEQSFCTAWNRNTLLHTFLNKPWEITAWNNYKNDKILKRQIDRTAFIAEKDTIKIK